MVVKDEKITNNKIEKKLPQNISNQIKVQQHETKLILLI